MKSLTGIQQKYQSRENNGEISKQIQSVNLKKNKYGRMAKNREEFEDQTDETEIVVLNIQK